VVCLGASAGGLETFRRFFRAMPAGNGMAFVLIQHLDPHHPGLMAELLATATPMPVIQVSNRTVLRPETLHVIPPGSYLALKEGFLWLSEPPERQGIRLPFDFFLRSLALDYGKRAICCVLSGTGTDGSLGLKAIKEAGGLVVAQDPDEAAFNGMPASALLTGCVDLVLPVEQMPAALLRYSRHHYLQVDDPEPAPADRAPRPSAPLPLADELTPILTLLRDHNGYDFSLYKRGTLQRRIERRMALAETGEPRSYLELLRQTPEERELLAKDLLINVTHFFRDPAAFAVLESELLPRLIERTQPGRPLRVWVAGCSSGEEPYSIAILLLEALATAKRTLKLQVFASDLDAEAVATARIGRYPETIAADVTPARLARYFAKEDQSYRVLPELRNVVVFTVHDLLSDPPFSRLDLVVCRNLLIYLGNEAQQRVLRLFHFALRDDGILFLGGSESIGALEDRFEPINKKQRLYRRVGRERMADLDFPLGIGPLGIGPLGLDEGAYRFLPRPGPSPSPRPGNPGDLARRALLERFAPPSVLVNRHFECLYFSGPTDRFLQLAEGEPNGDLLALARPGLRSRLRAALQRAGHEQTEVTISKVPLHRADDRADDGATVTLVVQPVATDGEPLYLVSFIDESPGESAIVAPIAGSGAGTADGTGDDARLSELERELEATREELSSATQNLELASEEQKAFYEEAMSVHEEFQSTNEELEISKEELQSLNEELTALNGQLQEMVEQQRAMANDLQNILNSADIATVFLDRQLNIRFFTPAARSLFRIIATDIGRPLADLVRRFDDPELLEHARAVLTSLVPQRREVCTESGSWQIRRILPYLTGDNRIEGVVLTFADISEIKLAQRQADQARAYSNRIIDTIRQPLVVLDQDLRVVSASPAFFRFFRCDAEDTLGRRLNLPDDDGANKAELAALLGRIKEGRLPVELAELELAVPGLGPCHLLLDIQEIVNEAVGERKYLLSIDDVTQAKTNALALEAARLQAEQANLAKSRFLAAASHDLRQPLQALVMLTGLLPRAEQQDPQTRTLIRRFEENLDVMSGILDTLLDINQLEAGVVRRQVSDFPVDLVLDALDQEFSLQARSRGLGWRVVQCRCQVRSDPALLKQMLRNLISNALKYTRSGKVLLGCRRAGRSLRIEVLDTGIGIADTEQKMIFKEFYQIDNPARERHRGLGLGLAIVERLGDLLGHPIMVQSSPGRGSCFSLSLPLVGGQMLQAVVPAAPARARLVTGNGETVLVVEDDPAVRQALAQLLERHGYRPLTAAAGRPALELARQQPPAIVIADYSLPEGMNGLQVIRHLRHDRPQLPALVLTGDISSEVTRAIAEYGCERLMKPAKVRDLLASIRRNLAAAPAPAPAPAHTAVPPLASASAATIFLIDDEPAVRQGIAQHLRALGYGVEAFDSGEAFLATATPGRSGCLVVDARLPGISGVALLERLKAEGYRLPSIMISGYADLPLAIEAMKAGSSDFIEKPMRIADLQAAIERALAPHPAQSPLDGPSAEALAAINRLTPRQRQILELVLAGIPNKNIARELGLSPRTVENHRAAIMRQTGSKSLAELVRLALAAGKT